MNDFSKIDQLSPDDFLKMFAEADDGETGPGVLVKYAFFVKALLVSARKSVKDDVHWRLNLVAYFCAMDEMLSKLFSEFQTKAVRAERAVVRACRDSDYGDAADRKQWADDYGAKSMQAAVVYGISVMLGSLRMEATAIAVRHATGIDPRPGTGTLVDALNRLAATLDDRVARAGLIATARGL